MSKNRINTGNHFLTLQVELDVGEKYQYYVDRNLRTSTELLEQTLERAYNLVRTMANLRKKHYSLLKSRPQTDALVEQKKQIQEQLSGLRKRAKARANETVKGQNLPSKIKDGVIASFDAMVDSYLGLLDTENQKAASGQVNNSKSFRLTRYPKEFNNFFMSLQKFETGGYALLERDGVAYLYMCLYSGADKNTESINLTDYRILGLTGVDGKERTFKGNLAKNKAGQVFRIKYNYDRLWNRFLRHGGVPKSVTVVRRGSKYFANISFEFPTEIRETKNYMGIDRGINSLAAYAVVRPDLSVIDEGLFDGKELRQYQLNVREHKKSLQRKYKQAKGNRVRRKTDHEVHVISTRLVSKLLETDSCMVFEKLSGLSQGPGQKRAHGARRSSSNHMLNRAQYGKLQNYMEYKSMHRGVQGLYEVLPARSSITCSGCGHVDKESRNKDNREEFRCTSCGFELNADLNAARIIAYRGIFEEEIRQKGGSFKNFVPEFERWFQEKLKISNDLSQDQV